MNKLIKKEQQAIKQAYKTKWTFFAERLSSDFPLIMVNYFLEGQKKYTGLREILYINMQNRMLAYRGENELRNFYKKIRKFRKRDFNKEFSKARFVFDKADKLFKSISHRSLVNLSEKEFKQKVIQFHDILVEFCGYFVYLQHIGRALENQAENIYHFDEKLLYDVRVKPVIKNSLVAIQKICRVIGNKKNINPKLLIWALPEEWIKLLKNGTSYQDELKKTLLLRRAFYLLTFYKGKKFISSNRNEIKNIAKSLEIKNTGTTEIIKGISANRGYMKGIAKVVLSKKDFKKVKNGDILVAITTMPYYLPILKKVSAIIVNEGGLLTHAAIMSRELNKPCIIGTKIATQVLKDGDMVEVDAERGIVSILKRN